jgi:hypothetical protein
MPQGILPFKYEKQRAESGMTALAGLPVYQELAQAVGLCHSAFRHLGLRQKGQGWTDGQIVLALVLLNLAGGDSVEDLRILKADAGFCRILEASQTHGRTRKERRAMLQRWRKQQTCPIPSPSAVFRYLNGFHDPAWDAKQTYGWAWVPSDVGALSGFAAINAKMLAFLQRGAPQETATLAMDATLVETHKREALRCYQHFKAYQPMQVWWAEQKAFVHTQFRAGNVPAGFGQKRVLEEALALLPAGVKRVRLRSDTAGYQHELLSYCHGTANKRFGRIEFTVSCPVAAAFKRSVAAVPESAWKPLHRLVAGREVPTGRKWAEVGHVTDGAGTSKDSPAYRYIAIREPFEEQEMLPGTKEAQEPTCPTVELECGRYKLFGLVSNMEGDGEALVRWHYERCGDSEHAHAGLKSDLAGGKLPSGRFGANAAWWWISVLAFNLNAIMKGLMLGEEWKPKRMKAIRFHVINIAGRVVRHSRQWVIRLVNDHPALDLLVRIRRRIASMLPVPT